MGRNWKRGQQHARCFPADASPPGFLRRGPAFLNWQTNFSRAHESRGPFSLPLSEDSCGVCPPPLFMQHSTKVARKVLVMPLSLPHIQGWGAVGGGGGWCSSLFCWRPPPSLSSSSFSSSFSHAALITLGGGGGASKADRTTHQPRWRRWCKLHLILLTERRGGDRRGQQNRPPVQRDGD